MDLGKVAHPPHPGSRAATFSGSTPSLTDIATARPDGYKIGMGTVELTMLPHMGLAAFTTDELEAPPGEAMDLDEAARTWFAFLLADPSPYPPMVQLWIGQYHSQIGDLALEPTNNGHALFD